MRISRCAEEVKIYCWRGCLSSMSKPEIFKSTYTKGVWFVQGQEWRVRPFPLPQIQYVNHIVYVRGLWGILGACKMSAVEMVIASPGDARNILGAGLKRFDSVKFCEWQWPHVGHDSAHQKPGTRALSCWKSQEQQGNAFAVTMQLKRKIILEELIAFEATK